VCGPEYRRWARIGCATRGGHREAGGVGVPLPEISQVLRHRSLASTAIYARADVDQLRTLAQPWPNAEAAQ
jgi:hypothetical protein